jgi:hypothetical protein
LQQALDFEAEKKAQEKAWASTMLKQSRMYVHAS